MKSSLRRPWTFPCWRTSSPPVPIGRSRHRLHPLPPQPRRRPTTPSPHAGAREVRVEERLHADAQLIMQDVIDEILPLIEAELRKRLNGRLQQLVEEQLDREGSAGL